MRKKHVSPQEGYDLYSPYYKKDHDYLDSFDWGPARRLLTPLLKPERRILDIGAGDGRIGMRLAKDYPGYFACDISRNMLKILTSKPQLQGKSIQCEATMLPFKENSFDILLAFFLIVHIDKLDHFFQESFRILKPGGHLLLNNIPQHTAPILQAGEEKIIIDSSYHSDKEVYQLAEEAGFFLKASHEEIQRENKVSTVMLFTR
jgi:ubiquinone/menaquinone biosynthesis C-methylase UbiE